MARYSVSRFGGSTPRLAKHLGSEVTAGLALDCKLWHGTLESWRELRFILDTEASTRFVQDYGCCWLEFQDCVSVAEGAIPCRQLYVTGLRDYPVRITFETDGCEYEVNRLGLPCPEEPPGVSPSSGFAAERDTESRSYAYQWVTEEGARSALSLASEPVIMRDGDSATITIPPAPFGDEWDIAEVWIYCTVSGPVWEFQAAREAGNVMDTSWMRVAEIPVAIAGTTVYTDNLRNENLESALEEDVTHPPPQNLQGIIAIGSINMLAGFEGNRIWFSENNSYDEWPYYIDLDDNVCAIRESNSVIYVATDGNPYAISAATGCENGGCWDATRLPEKFPFVGCGPHRMIAMPGGAIYPTHDGLVQLSGSGVPQLITEPLYAADDWHELFPETVLPAIYNGFLFVFARGGAFVLRLPNGPQSGWELDTHSELSDREVYQAFTTRNGNFMLLKPDGLWEWDKGNTLREHRWESMDVLFPAPVNLSAGIVRVNGSEQIRVTVEGKEVIDRDVIHRRAFRLPAWAQGAEWKIRLTGTGKVSIVDLATSMREL